MTENDFDKAIAEAEAEAEAIKSRRLEILAGIGEKALPEIDGKPEFADLLAQLDEAEKQAEELVVRMAKIQEEKIKFERAEKERVARYTCVACRNVNNENSRFCEECGGKVGDLPREFCKICCTLNYQSLKFCGECGAKLEDNSAL